MLQFLFRHFSQSHLPQTDGRLYLPGLRDRVTIQRDRWGIPHIQAANRHDLFFAQGVVHAQDRLWQMELNRRAATGTLSALLGPATLDTDRLARTLGFARLARQSWECLSERVRADVLAYTDGVNAYLNSRPPLPVEFSLLRHTPAPWQPLDTVAYGRLQMWALSNGASGELPLAQLIKAVGEARAAELAPHYPAGNPLTLPGGIEVNALALDGMMGSGTAAFLGKGGMDGAGRGSNGWVISPARSATDHAILCNDMHLPIGTPSLWYFLRLHLPRDGGLAVAGFSQPGLPYVLVGRNAHIAWGATLAYTDCEDLFVEKLHPETPTRYLFAGEWRAAEIIEERIAVRGQPDHVERVTLTHHGPIVSPVLPCGGQVLALSSTALQAETVFDGFARLNEARNWEDFVSAVSHIHAPALNLLYADVHGNIGHYVSGRVPVRAAGDGRVPAPGWRGDHEWIGFIPFDDMPHALNPAQGYIISANNRIIGDDYPHYLGQIWRNGYRAGRLEQLLTGQAKISLADCRRFHLDVTTLPGQALVAYLDHFDTAQPAAALALRLLRAWDGRLTPDSVGGAVYEVLLAQLARAILEPCLEPAVLNDCLGVGPHPILAPVNEFQGYWTATLLRLLANPNSAWLPADERHAVIERALAATTAELRRRLGNDPAGWQWGRLHRVRFAHALGAQRPLNHLFDQGPYPIGGDGDTVAQAGIRPDAPYDNNAISVSSRHIVEMGGDPANSIAMLAPGQSGHPGSPHYGDLIRPWLAGEYFPMAGREAEVRHCLTLSPPLGL